MADPVLEPTDKEIDAYLSELPDAELCNIINGTSNHRLDLQWFRPKALAIRMAKELLALREEIRAMLNPDRPSP